MRAEFINPFLQAATEALESELGSADSVAEHSHLFRDVGLYSQAVQVVSDPDEFARRIAQAGYSTDPSYAAKLVNLMHHGDLYRLDAPAEPIIQTA